MSGVNIPPISFEKDGQKYEFQWDSGGNISCKNLTTGENVSPSMTDFLESAREYGKRFPNENGDPEKPKNPQEEIAEKLKKLGTRNLPPTETEALIAEVNAISAMHPKSDVVRNMAELFHAAAKDKKSRVEFVYDDQEKGMGEQSSGGRPRVEDFQRDFAKSNLPEGSLPELRALQLGGEVTSVVTEMKEGKFNASEAIKRMKERRKKLQQMMGVPENLAGKNPELVGRQIAEKTGRKMLRKKRRVRKSELSRDMVRSAGVRTN